MDRADSGRAAASGARCPCLRELHQTPSRAARGDIGVTSRGPIDWVRGATYGAASAALFGISAPVSKRLLPDVGPVMLAGLLYLGAGLGLTIVAWARKRPWPRFS